MYRQKPIISEIITELNLKSRNKHETSKMKLARFSGFG